MKNASLLLNLVLLLAVGFLYYKVYGDDKLSAKTANATPATSTGNTNTAKAPGALIAYVDLDSLNERISFIKTKRGQFEAEQKGIESDWENGRRGLENKKNNFIKAKGNNMTQAEAEKFQAELMGEMQEIEQRKQNRTQVLSEKSYNFLEEIQKKLKEFLVQYNKEKNYQYILTTGTGMDYMIFKDSTLNITPDVVKGMNEEFAKQKK
ncbi:MAG: OmpH family outer membrane protein [Ferruginibacter sp.]